MKTVSQGLLNEGVPLNYQSMTSKCPLGKCDGTGVFNFTKTVNGQEINYYAVCDCQKDRTQMKKRSDIPFVFSDCTINSFDVERYDEANKLLAKAAKKAAAKYIFDYACFKEEGKGLYLQSNTKGSGKTRLACSIGNALIQAKFISVKFVKTIELLENIKSTYNNKSDISQKMVIDNVKHAEMLILDDIGAENPTDWACEIFLNILDYRITNKLPVIFTSNIRMDNLKLDERIIDRIFKLAIEMKMPEESIRRKESTEENEALEKILYD